MDAALVLSESLLQLTSDSAAAAANAASFNLWVLMWSSDRIDGLRQPHAVFG